MSITNSRMKWKKDINVFMSAIANTNWSTNTVQGNSLRNGYKGSTGAQNASISFDITLARGTWLVELLHNKGTDVGTYSVQIDSVEKGTIDGYNGSTTYNNRNSVTGISISTPGKHRLTLQMSTKNASSSSYYGRIQHIQLRRTA